MKTRRLIVGISGSSGAILGIRLLEMLKEAPIETHLIVTASARLTIEQETEWKLDDVLSLADMYYENQNLGAPIASGSFEAMGMIVIPCSIKSLSAVANSYSSDLLSRAADVTLKEGRPLVLVLREAPLHAGHIRQMSMAAQSGAVIFPPVPAFYTHPVSLDEVVDNIVGRVLRRIGIENEHYVQWPGIEVRNEHPSVVSEGASRKSWQNREEDLWNLPAMTLATTSSDGDPYAATVYFASSQEHDLYFFSSPESRHAANLAEKPRAAVTIYPIVENWQDILGLQMRGSVQPVPQGKDWERAWSIYLEKFPFVSGLNEIIKQNTLYVFHPDWIRLVDNQRGFGFKNEWVRE